MRKHNDFANGFVGPISKYNPLLLLLLLPFLLLVLILIIILIVLLLLKDLQVHLLRHAVFGLGLNAPAMLKVVLSVGDGCDGIRKIR